MGLKFLLMIKIKHWENKEACTLGKGRLGPDILRSLVFTFFATRVRHW